MFPTTPACVPYSFDSHSKLSYEKSPDCLGFIGDYTTQLFVSWAVETKPTDMTWGLPYTIVRIPPVIHLFSAMKKGFFSLQLSRTSRKEVFHRSRPGSLNNQYNRPVIKVPILAGSNTARSSRE